ELEVSDRTVGAELARRAQEIAAREQAERQKRLASGKPLTRLSRDLEKVALGMKQDAVVKALPRGAGARQRPITGGLAVVFMGSPPGNGYAVRELFALFDRAGKASEVRVRCTDVPGQAAGGAASLLGRLKTKYGVPETLPAPWVAAWAGLPEHRPA